MPAATFVIGALTWLNSILSDSTAVGTAGAAPGASETIENK